MALRILIARADRAGRSSNASGPPARTGRHTNSSHRSCDAICRSGKVEHNHSLPSAAYP